MYFHKTQFYNFSTLVVLFLYYWVLLIYTRTSIHRFYLLIIVCAQIELGGGQKGVHSLIVHIYKFSALFSPITFAFGCYCCLLLADCCINLGSSAILSVMTDIEQLYI